MWRLIIQDIIAFAHNRLKETITQPKKHLHLYYQNKVFTLSRRQTYYEIILEQEIDKRNFRKKLWRLILSLKQKREKMVWLIGRYIWRI